MASFAHRGAQRRLHPGERGPEHRGGGEKRQLTIGKLEAMTSVCSVGLDMVAIPGDTTAETIAGIIRRDRDGVINGKSTRRG